LESPNRLLIFPKKKQRSIDQQNQSAENLPKGNQSASTFAQVLLNDGQSKLPKK
jgi:hypothetical protein